MRHVRAYIRAANYARGHVRCVSLSGVMFRRLTISKMPLRLSAAVACFVLGLLSPVETENAIANGDTRTLHLHHTHTGESIDATFRVNGQYDYAVLEKLNWFLRDWRRDEPTKMDPRLFDVVWETYRESGSSEPIQIVSAYRSPQTNAMLRSRSKAVAEHSQHILGKAMDMHYVDVPMSKIREIGMRLQRGGVGYYPTAGTPFVHLDVGSVRAWPRMNYDQLVRLFPDGKTVHLPPNGQPLARYEEARAEIDARGGSYTPSLSEVRSRGFFASLFGSSDDDEDGGSVRNSNRGRARVASLGTATGIGPNAEDESSGAYFTAEAARREGRGLNNPRLGRANVDLPPTTPRSLARIQPDMIAQNNVPAPTPALQQNINTTAPQIADVPLPPRRPDELIARADIPSDVPLPPVRPDHLRLALNTDVARPTPLPDLITHGDQYGTEQRSRSTTEPALPRDVLAYASSADQSLVAAQPPAPSSSAQNRQHRISLSPAQLDASNYHSLTASLSLSAQKWSAQTSAPPKHASRTEINRILFGPALSVAQNFAPTRPSMARAYFQPLQPTLAPILALGIDRELDPIVTGSLSTSLH